MEWRGAVGWVNYLPTSMVEEGVLVRAPQLKSMIKDSTNAYLLGRVISKIYDD